MNLIGLKLEIARAILASQGIEKIAVRETLPPHAEKATGEWRVLRCRVSEDGVYEIDAAREQLSD